MKLNSIIIGLIVFIVSQANAQEFSYPVKYRGEDLSIEITVGYTGLTLTGSTDNTITIKALEWEKQSDSRAEGLKPVTPWPDNTGLGLNITEEGNRIEIVKSDARSRVKYEISVPSKSNVHVKENVWGKGDFKISGIRGDVDIQSNSSDIEINDVSGSVRAKTTSGDMTVQLPISGNGLKHDISSVSGTTRIVISDSGSYSLNLNTISGSINTAFELKKEITYKGSTLHRIGRIKDIEMDLNGGGDRIDADTVSGLLSISYTN